MEPQYAKKDSFFLGSGKLICVSGSSCAPWRHSFHCVLKQQPNFYGFKLLKTNKLKLSMFKVS